MNTILNIDTSTTVCSVALSAGGECLSMRKDESGNSHSRVIGVFTQQLLQEADSNGWKVAAVALSQGPGSYTGLRIGTSFAKGLCYGMDIPLIAIPTLKIMAWAVAQKLKMEDVHTDALLCPMIDARRMEVYSAVYNMELNEVEAVSAKIIDHESFSDLLANRKIYFFGNGSNKCKDAITSHNATFIDGVNPLATDMAVMAHEAYNKKEFADVAYFEPFYLKDFIATKPKRLGV
ncbi:MAG: tRNA (adenosine(37)-N6)-threonylcarbamoyltransferase complex dimerization subunit type 1 TsaB [Paludibacteraceae bacterium]|nr:tRNA (adenosine(37)-N6)-threonylcarbamoyltransferase complex dimerization subunit type 1 TsaB [Paludibacteraceae bacterium]